MFVSLAPTKSKILAELYLQGWGGVGWGGDDNVQVRSKTDLSIDKTKGWGGVGMITYRSAGTTETESAGTTESESAGTTEALPLYHAITTYRDGQFTLSSACHSQIRPTPWL